MKGDRATQALYRGLAAHRAEQSRLRMATDRKSLALAALRSPAACGGMLPETVAGFIGAAGTSCTDEEALEALRSLRAVGKAEEIQNGDARVWRATRSK